MVLVTGAVVGAVATFPPAVALFGQVGASAAAASTIPAGAAAAGTSAGAVTLYRTKDGLDDDEVGLPPPLWGPRPPRIPKSDLDQTSFLASVGEGAVVGVGAIGGGSNAGIALATFVGPIGWAVVGCKNDDHDGDSGYTWDCWKPVVRDTLTRPSYGMTLRCLAAHPNVRSMSLDRGGLLVGNIFGERFCLTPVSVEGTLAFHASILSS